MPAGDAIALLDDEGERVERLEISLLKLAVGYGDIARVLAELLLRLLELDNLVLQLSACLALLGVELAHLFSVVGRLFVGQLDKALVAGTRLASASHLPSRTVLTDVFG